jgi:hypothetical protein
LPLTTQVLPARRSRPSLPCHCGGKCSVSLLRTCDGLGFNSGPYLARGPSRAKPGWPVGRRRDAVGRRRAVGCGPSQPRNGPCYQGAPNGHLSDVHRAKTGGWHLGAVGGICARLWPWSGLLARAGSNSSQLPHGAESRAVSNGPAMVQNATDEGIVADALLRCTLSLDGSWARCFLYCAVGIHRAAGICPGIIQGGAIARAREVSMGASDIKHPVGTLRAR